MSSQSDTYVNITGGQISGLNYFGVSCGTNAAIAGFSLGTITDTTARALPITQTWNNSGLVGCGLLVNITDTASSASSKLLDLQVGGTSKVKVTKAASILVAEQSSTTAVSIGAGTGSGFITFYNGQIGAGTQGQGLFWGSAGRFEVLNGTPLCFNASGTVNNGDLFLGRGAAATLQLGQSSGTPVAQAIRACLATGSNVAGSNLTLQSGNGTGTGGSGNIVFQTAPTGSTGSTANTMRDVLIILPDGSVMMPNLKTSSAGLAAGTLWKNGSAINVA
jgi:hypothetical protein